MRAVPGIGRCEFGAGPEAKANVGNSPDERSYMPMYFLGVSVSLSINNAWTEVTL